MPVGNHDDILAMSKEEKERLQRELQARPISYYHLPKHTKVVANLIQSDSRPVANYRNWYYCVLELAKQNPRYRAIRTIQQLPREPPSSNTASPAWPSTQRNPPLARGVARHLMYREIGAVPRTPPKLEAVTAPLLPRSARTSNLLRRYGVLVPSEVSAVLPYCPVSELIFTKSQPSTSQYLVDNLAFMARPRGMPTKYFYYQALRSCGPFVFRSSRSIASSPGFYSRDWSVLTGLKCEKNGTWLAEFFRFECLSNSFTGRQEMHLTSERDVRFFEGDDELDIRELDNHISYLLPDSTGQEEIFYFRGPVNLVNLAKVN